MAPSVVVLLLLLVIFEVNSEDQCPNIESNQCACFHTEDYEIQCPPFEYNILIHGVPKTELSIDCHNMDSFNTSLLPNYKSGNNTSVTLRFCPLPEDNFQEILHKFDIYHFSRLKLENVSLPETSNNQSISKNVFDGLSGLKDLTLTYISTKLDDDVLDVLQNLISFELDHSEIDDISSLRLPESLKILHFTGNLISDIPDGAFRNLRKVYQLHLWGNKISKIRKDAFLGLDNLTSLELSSNVIDDIEKGSFDNLKDLKSLSLRYNKLSNISDDIFRYNKKLTSIRMEDNPKLILPDYVFANLSNLDSVNLKHSGIESLPANVFRGAGNVKSIRLENNLLQNLPETVFADLARLEKLDLSRNKLNDLPNEIFSSLKRLTELNLSFNNISSIQEDLFKETINLEKLVLSNNKITSIELTSFYKLKKLTHIDLSNNLYSMQYKLGEGNPFNNCLSLKTIILNNNKIEEIPDFNVFVYLEEVDLSYNKLKAVDLLPIATQPSENLKSIKLSYNEIAVVNFEGVETVLKLNEVKTSVDVDLENNRLTCDCAIYPLIRYLKGDFPVVRTRVNLLTEGAHCAGPDMFKHILISDLRKEHISCERHVDGCPKECQSFWRPYKDFYVFDCSNRNLTSFPKILTNQPLNIEINLRGNVIKGGLNSSLGYEYVKNLFLSNNKLQELKWIPPEIEELTLDSNELTHLEPELLEVMNRTSLRVLKLSRNPWSCECSALKLQVFIQDNYQKISPNDVMCKDANKPLVEIRELCKSSSKLILLTVLPILSFLLLTIVGLILYIYYRQEVKIWLFSKNLCLWFVSEEELDEDKKYDIFLSYSHKDEDFVVHNLLPVLESGPRPLKTCIHIRDWEAGELILTHVTNSVYNSRRTLVVLSNNFLESVWGIMEFRTAHMKALEDGRTRLIVVKYGDLDETRLDSDLKAYLSTNTYIEWGTQWFWNKLKYALPHSKRSGFYKSNQKHASVMLKIDDKFELTSPPLKHPESTPPVIALDPALLKKHPLTFNTDSNRTSEAPLVVNN